MFPLAAAGQANAARRPGAGAASTIGRWRSRVRGLPEVLGELPVATLADEIETPGEGQVRALITVAGNPCVSTPNAGRLTAALDGPRAAWSALDVYVNETTRHADVILPGAVAARARRTTTSRSTSWRSATWPTGRRRLLDDRRCRRSGRRCCG